MSSPGADAIEVPAWCRAFRRYPMDGALLLFDRDTGTNVLCDGPETAHLRREAPRVVQFAITNRCNLTCGFCYRDHHEVSAWTADTAFTVLRGLDARGVLEVAFGGGEPFAFPGFVGLLERLHRETRLALSVTTNGTLLTPTTLQAIAPFLGQVRLSVYDETPWRDTMVRMVEARVRFGVNYLVTPARLPSLEATVLDLVSRGCRDVLLLSYNGNDDTLHLAPDEARALSRRLATLARALGSRCALKLGICFGDRLPDVPRLLEDTRCLAGSDFVVLTSGGDLMPCSFHHVRIPVRTAEDVLATWSSRRDALSRAARIRGCARPHALPLVQQV